MQTDSDALKEDVQAFWQAGSCGEVYAQGDTERERFAAHASERYTLEPYIIDFARTADGKDKDVLEIGVGMGADHLMWAQSGPRSLTGVDLTQAAVDKTLRRLELHGLSSDVRVADAEALPFDDDSFDIVYSWGVLHHTPRTAEAINEVHRVLRPGGIARIAIYHRRSIMAMAMWFRYGLARGRPWMSLEEVYRDYVESPGTKAYTVDEGRALFERFEEVDARVQLSFGDLLEGAAGQRHEGLVLSAARRLWPRRTIRTFFPHLGGYLMLDARA